MIELSGVIITFNEERNIGRCIDSLKQVADDIVVVDSFSTDKTEEICKEKRGRFIRHKFEGHVQQKNYAIKHAEYPYVLSLDADEFLSKELIKSILRVKESWKYDGYYMNRLTYYCGKPIRHCGWYPDKKLRLWDRRNGRWAGVNPHDRFEMEPECKIGFLKGDILHYTYYTISEHVEQANRFSDISAKQLFEIGRHSSWITVLFRPFYSFLILPLISGG